MLIRTTRQPLRLARRITPLAAASLLATLPLVAVHGTATAQEGEPQTVTVTDADPQGWAIESDPIGGAAVGFAPAPDDDLVAHPAPPGNLALTTGAPQVGGGTARITNATDEVTGTALADLTLEYSTLVTDRPGNSQVAPYLILEVDLVVPGAEGETLPATLVFEPQFTGTPSTDTWQSWDATHRDAVWWSLTPVPVGDPVCLPSDLGGVVQCTWKEITNNQDDAVVRSLSIGIGDPLRAGDPNWTNVTAYADALLVGTGGGDETLYDFERVDGTGVSLLYPSNDCALGTTVFDGFVGDTYVRLQTATPGPTTAWVCVAADDGTTHVGGKLVVDDTAPVTPTVDGDQAACSDDPANERLRDMTIGPDDEPMVIDLTPRDGEVWLCVEATSQVSERVVVPVDTGGTTFLPDAAAPFPYVEAPAPLGQPSSACQEAATGTRTRLLNADVGDTHVWLSTWQESSASSHVCVRVEGATDGGGRLDLDTAGGQTFATADASDDFTPCSVPVVSDSGTPPYDVRISDPQDGPPAWACVQVGGVYQRVSLDTGGGQGVVAFTADDDTA